jgi:hypothetical protein
MATMVTRLIRPTLIAKGGVEKARPAVQRLWKEEGFSQNIAPSCRRKMVDIRRNFRLRPELSQIQEGLKSPRKTRRSADIFERIRGKMVTFDNLVHEIDARYCLGPKAAPLIQETSRLVSKQPGGIGGVVRRFRDAGFAVEVASC